ncbi:MAG: RNA polymerase sigma-70 factor [Candidatus Cryptobacteroides sp.]|nr:RNA polymerase sigma-70 factor [Bacteroidales bacterium]MDY3964243.1 RNA polymerase sigma-70 factor [Candidatus Cryptobacteroides sp.]
MMLASSISAEEFGRLFLRFKDKFISIACSFTRDRAAAEDIVTESFTAFWNGREHIELKSLPEAYVLQSVRNRCLNYMRNKAVRMRIEGDINSVSARAVEMEADILSEESISFLFRDEVQEIFMNFMKTMPDLTRKIFLASRMEGLTYNEIAERYGVTPRKVKRDIQKVLEIMRISLKDYLPVLLLVFPGLFRI